MRERRVYRKFRCKSVTANRLGFLALDSRCIYGRLEHLFEPSFAVATWETFVRGAQLVQANKKQKIGILEINRVQGFTS